MTTSVAGEGGTGMWLMSKLLLPDPMEVPSFKIAVMIAIVPMLNMFVEPMEIVVRSVLAMRVVVGLKNLKPLDFALKDSTFCL